jgi:hypothetical protein
VVAEQVAAIYSVKGRIVEEEVKFKEGYWLKSKIIVIVANLIVIISPIFTFWTVNNENDLESVKFGFPFPFVIQDQSLLGPPLPYKMQLQSPIDNPTNINWLSLLGSLLVINLVLYFFFLIRKRK